MWCSDLRKVQGSEGAKSYAGTKRGRYNSRKEEEEEEDEDRCRVNTCGEVVKKKTSVSRHPETHRCLANVHGKQNDEPKEPNQ